MYLSLNYFCPDSGCIPMFHYYSSQIYLDFDNEFLLECIWKLFRYFRGRIFSGDRVISRAFDIDTLVGVLVVFHLAAMH